MKSTDFVVTGRPRLAAIKRFPAVEFADYERRLAAMQETLQRVQQAYLGRTWDYAQKIDEAIAAVTLDRVNAALRKYVDAAGFAYSYAGDFAKAKP